MEANTLVLDNGSVMDIEKTKKYVERIEALNAEKDSLVEDIKEVYTEMKHAGFTDKQISLVRNAINIRRRDPDEAKSTSEMVMSLVDALDGAK